MNLPRDSLTSRATTWCCTAGLVAVLCFLAGFSVLTQRHAASRTRATDQATRLAAAYTDARYWVGQEESLERKYRIAPGADVLALYEQAQGAVVRDLSLVRRLDSSAATRRFVASVRRAHAAYVEASHELFDAVDSNETGLVKFFDLAVTDPAFHVLQTDVYQASASATQTALRESASLRHDEGSATRTIIAAFAVGLLLILAFGGILIRLRHRLAASWKGEIESLAKIAMRDPLTGLGNHRAFHEEFTEALHGLGGSSGLSLILLDLDGLKVVNDTLGHQAGDEYIKVVAEALRTTMQASAGLYRVGGDEFAVVLPGEGATGAKQLVERLQASLTALERPIRVSISAGIVEAPEYRHKDALMREADIALLVAKRGQQGIVVYTPELENESRAGTSRLQTGTLANALALAVDAKDSYTRSHCQTVSHLCAMLAEELELSPARVARMRLAGLLHDVGKIGVPDAILNKPGALTDDEYEQMKRHSTLGGEIVAAANLAEESDWIRHHHERYDGTGYPSRLSGKEIPLESRIILACDAYEAMTSNRPYRKAPGHAFAIAELKRHAGTQFDPEVVDAICRALKTHAGVVQPDLELAQAA
jgi:diguanylate cyclase (GGDEF)-like protein/putative nucleotidyltransferase with HDIG domain